MTPLSTVCRSSTLNESYGHVMLGSKEVGKTDNQVLSPMNAIFSHQLRLSTAVEYSVSTFFPASFSCLIIESSSISSPPKFEPISTKVGRLPVVKPLILCRVVVGGSASALNSRLCLGYFFVNSAGKVNTLWWYEEYEGSLRKVGEIKSKRSASIMMTTALLWVGLRTLDGVRGVVFGSDKRVRRKPEVNK